MLDTFNNFVFTCLITSFICIFILWLFMYFNNIKLLEFDYNQGIIIIKTTRLVKDKTTGFTNTIIYRKEIILWQK